MTLNNVKLYRDQYLKSCSWLTVTTDENMTFDSREAFLIWQDDKETLIVIGPNKNLGQVMHANRRGETYCIPYDRILYLNAVPDLSKLDVLFTDMGITDADLVDKVKKAFENITNVEAFMTSSSYNNGNK